MWDMDLAMGDPRDDDAAGFCRLDRGLGPFSPAMLINLCCCIIFTIAYVRTWSNERDAPKEKKSSKKPEYGYGASGITLLLAVLGLLFGAPIIILYFIWKQLGKGEIACSIAWTSLGLPVWPCIFTLLIFALVFGSWVRLRKRVKVVAALGIGCTDRVLVTPVYKGLFLTAAAKHIRGCTQKASLLTGDNDNSGQVGGVVGVDIWRREVREWCEENVHREGMAPLVTLRDQERTYGINYRLPCSDGEFDVVFVPFLASHSFCNQRGDSDESRRIKLQMMITEYYRVLKPGGRLLTQNITWKVKELTAAFKDGSPFTDVITPTKWYWLAAFPSRLTIASKFERPLSTPMVVSVAESDIIIPPTRGASTSITIGGNGLPPSASSSLISTSPSIYPTTDAFLVSGPSAIGGVGVGVMPPMRMPARASIIVASPSVANIRVNNWTAASLQQSLTKAEPNRVTSPVHMINHHWPLRISMWCIFMGIYAAMSWLIARYWLDLRVPDRLPWHNKLNAMMASNLSLYPLVVFFNYQQVSAYCQLTTVSFLQLLQLLRTVFVELIMVFIVWNLLFWLPSLAIDLALYDHLSTAQLGYLNMAINLIIFYGLARGAKRLVFWLQRRGRIALNSATRNGILRMQRVGSRMSSRVQSRRASHQSLYPNLPSTDIRGHLNDDDPHSMMDPHEDNTSINDDDMGEDEAGPFTSGLHSGHAGGLSFDVVSPSSSQQSVAALRNVVRSRAASVANQPVAPSSIIHPHHANHNSSAATTNVHVSLNADNRVLPGVSHSGSGDSGSGSADSSPDGDDASAIRLHRSQPHSKGSNHNSNGSGAAARVTLAIQPPATVVVANGNTSHGAHDLRQPLLYN